MLHISHGPMVHLQQDQQANWIRFSQRTNHGKTPTDFALAPTRSAFGLLLRMLTTKDSRKFKESKKAEIEHKDPGKPNGSEQK